MFSASNIESPHSVSYELTSFPAPNDKLYSVDLSVERALSLIDESARHNHAALYSWFITNTESDNEFGSREYGRGQRLPGVDASFAHAAQRGIHAPSRQCYAATITIKRGSLYDERGLNGRRVELGDGTWLLSYAAHRNNTDGETTTIWNDGLRNCDLDDVSVGVFIEGITDITEHLLLWRTTTRLETLSSSMASSFRQTLLLFTLQRNPI